ncbi:MAG: hypothetical protein M1827_007495 [Pycnora praestabilis]|nr:MAG: hypothetical protein M1827_007495 [Pycnora praestabilis]
MLTPLTTYTYTTGSSENETVSATDEERLPPGGLSLRHGFPHWFRRSQRSAPTSAASSRNVSSSLGTEQESRQQESQEGWNGSARLYTSEQDLHSPLPPASRGVAGPNITLHPKRRKDVSTLEVLRYIKQSFDDETLLDSLPLDAAGNPGAWHAWRSHRMKTRHIPRPSPSLPLDDNESSDAGSEETLSVGYQHSAGSTSADRARRPGEWNWEGVWEDRVRRGIEGSRSEAVLYGSAGETSDLCWTAREIKNQQGLGLGTSWEIFRAVALGSTISYLMPRSKRQPQISASPPKLIGPSKLVSSNGIGHVSAETHEAIAKGENLHNKSAFCRIVAKLHPDLVITTIFFIALLYLSRTTGTELFYILRFIYVERRLPTPPPSFSDVWNALPSTPTIRTFLRALTGPFVVFWENLWRLDTFGQPSRDRSSYRNNLRSGQVLLVRQSQVEAIERRNKIRTVKTGSYQISPLLIPERWNYLTDTAVNQAVNEQAGTE